MFLLYTQPVIQADATGLFLLILFLAPFIIPAIVKKSKISEAEEIKNNYPDGYNRVMRYRGYIDYQNAKVIVEKKPQIVAAQHEFEEELRKAAEEKRIKEKVNSLRRECPYATQGKSDRYIIDNEYSIRRSEKRHIEREIHAKKILHDYPLGVRELYGFISDLRISDDDIDKLINNETDIQIKQKECEANEAELQILRPRLIAVRKKCPLAVLAICRENNWSTSNAEHVKLLLLMPGGIAERQELEEDCLLASKERMAKAVNDAKVVISNHDKNRARSYISGRYGERIAEKVMETIKIDEDFQIISKHLDSIGKVQNAFAKETRNIIPDILKGWGYFNYDFTMQYQDDNSNVKSNTLTVWQTFNDCCCFDDSVSYDYYPSFKKKRVAKTLLESDYCCSEDDWDNVMSFLSQIKSKYGDELFVVLANTDHLNEKAFQKNFNYIKNQLKKANISYGESFLTEKHNSLNKKYVVLDIITENSNLIQYCSSLFHYRHIMHINDNNGTTGVVFISMLKCYDGAEVEELNNRKIKEQEDALRKAKEEEEKKRKEQRDISEAKNLASTYPIGFKRFFPDCSSISIDAYKARRIVQKKSAIRDFESTLSRLRNSVSGWNTVRGVPHYFFYYYYPTRFTDVSSVSQEARRLIYNFKDGIAHNDVKYLIVRKIRDTFNSVDLSKICFVCIPASTRTVNQSRYECFSYEVCHDLGISDGYNHITIIKEKNPSHLGGSDTAEYSYDKSFFNDKFVVLFDDIVTRGNSISSMKTELEALGAIVICAISIGRTYSDWNGNSPKPHPWTGTL